MTLGPATALLQVFDMNAALAFYRALGFTVAERSPAVEDGGERYSHWCRLSRDDATLMLNTAYDSIADRPAGIAPERYAAHGDTCLYIDCGDADALHAEFAAAGMACAAPNDTPYGMRQLYVPDPDGYLLCFQHPI